jgi:predicted dehydrogenase
LAAMVRVCVAGLIHDHVWGMLRWWRESEEATLVAAADLNPPLLERARAEYGIETTYHSYEEMFDREKPDIVLITTDNAGTVDVVEAAAARGIHVQSEKPMSATLEQADRMVRAAEKAGILLMINWPTAWSPAIQTMDRLIREGRIGRPVQTRYRAAHNGPKEIGCSPYFYEWLYDRKRNGAGALMDYCCYGADLASHWLGKPKSAVGIAGRLVKDYIDVDDNAIILAKYPDAVGIAEASWTQIAPEGGANPTVYGTEGTVSVVGHRVRLARGEGEAQLLEPDTPPPGRRNGAEYLLSCLRSGSPLEGMCSPQVSRDAQAILAAGLRSAEEGREVPVE